MAGTTLKIDTRQTLKMQTTRRFTQPTLSRISTLIKAKDTNDFSDVDAHKLTLWRVSIPITDNDDEVPILLDNLPEKKNLKATAKLSSVFDTDLPEGMINILVRRPPPVHAPVPARGSTTLSGHLSDESLSSDLRADIKRITDKFFAPGSGVATFLDRFVHGLVNLPLTTGSVSGLPRVWLRNRSRCSDAYPSLLFSGLPDPSSNDAQSVYPTSDAIFGCWKTRDVIEVLSRRGGLYFNASGNDLGSDDVTTLISYIGPCLEQDREANSRQDRTITYLLLLSRLKILRYCLMIPGSYQTFTSARWTILQTCAHAFNNDVFDQLFSSLRPLVPVNLTSLTETDLEKATQEELQVTRDLLVEHGIQGGFPSFKDRDKLLVVYDEAQILGDAGDGLFKSISMNPEEKESGRPIYTLDWAWSSGSFNKPTESLTGKLDGFDCMEFPGWTGRESIEAYKAIARGDPDAWQDAVDDTEARLVSYEHRGERGNLCNEIVRLEDKYRANLSIFKGLRTVEEVLRLLLFQRYMFGADRLVLQEAVPELVEHAFGRIKIIDGVARTVLEEPFVLKAAKNYFKMRDTDLMEIMEWWIQQSDKAQAHGYAWELMMMNALPEAFKTHAFSDWPHDPSVLSQDCGLDEQDLQRGTSYEHISMEDFMEAHAHQGSRHDGRVVPPFFFPDAKPSGPDIVFYIQIKNKLFPAFVQRSCARYSMRRMLSRVSRRYLLNL
ncbi:hypothetical protein BGZ90_007467 [Linnemannia elongata]|nr:hypothetical protein BGZ90_007467 [Linnemannia elongata]